MTIPCGGIEVQGGEIGSVKAGVVKAGVVTLGWWRLGWWGWGGGGCDSGSLGVEVGIMEFGVVKVWGSGSLGQWMFGWWRLGWWVISGEVGDCDSLKGLRSNIVPYLFCKSELTWFGLETSHPIVYRPHPGQRVECRQLAWHHIQSIASLVLQC